MKIRIGWLFRKYQNIMPMNISQVPHYFTFENSFQGVFQSILFMSKFISTSIGRLRVLAFLEGMSLLLLVFVAMPIKYIGGDPSWVRTVGMAHGVLFLGFVFYAFQVAADKDWKFMDTTLKVLVASVVPFGTFYIDHRILSKYQAAE